MFFPCTARDIIKDAHPNLTMYVTISVGVHAITHNGYRAYDRKKNIARSHAAINSKGLRKGTTQRAAQVRMGIIVVDQD